MAADPRSTNIVPFPTPASRRPAALPYTRRRERPDWPSSAARRTPELLIALAVCKVLTPSQRNDVQTLLQTDRDLFNDRASNEATSICGDLG